MRYSVGALAPKKLQSIGASTSTFHGRDRASEASPPVAIRCLGQALRRKTRRMKRVPPTLGRHSNLAQATILGLSANEELRPGALGYYEPTVLDNVNRDMRIAWEETFGPVVTIIRVKNYES